MFQPSGAESYSGPDLKRWGAGTLGLGREGAARGGVEAKNNRMPEGDGGFTGWQQSGTLGV